MDRRQKARRKENRKACIRQEIRIKNKTRQNRIHRKGRSKFGGVKKKRKFIHNNIEKQKLKKRNDH